MEGGNDDARKLHHDPQEVKRECLKLINDDLKCSSRESWAVVSGGARYCFIILPFLLLLLLILLAMFVHNFYQTITI